MEKEVIINLKRLIKEDEVAKAMAAELKVNWRDELLAILSQALAEYKAQGGHAPTPEEVEHWQEDVRKGAYWVPSWYPTDEDAENHTPS